MVASRPLRPTFQGQEVSWQIINNSLLPVVGFDLDRGLICTSTPAASVDNLKIAPSDNVTCAYTCTHLFDASAVHSVDLGFSDVSDTAVFRGAEV